MVGSIETSSATWMTGQIEGRETIMLLDMGSAVTLLSAHVWETKEMLALVGAVHGSIPSISSW